MYYCLFLNSETRNIIIIYIYINSETITLIVAIKKKHDSVEIRLNSQIVEKN